MFQMELPGSHFRTGRFCTWTNSVPTLAPQSSSTFRSESLLFPFASSPPRSPAASSDLLSMSLDCSLSGSGGLAWATVSSSWSNFFLLKQPSWWQKQMKLCVQNFTTGKLCVQSATWQRRAPCLWLMLHKREKPRDSNLTFHIMIVNITRSRNPNPAPVALIVSSWGNTKNSTRMSCCEAVQVRKLAVKMLSSRRNWNILW